MLFDVNIKKRPEERLKPSKKSRWDFFTEASALPALIVGNADNSHSCADRSVFCLGKAEAKTD